MADVKTNLRELSVGLFFFDNQAENLNPSQFLNVCKNNIVNCSWLDIGNIASNESAFSYEEAQIIHNGIRLGMAIKGVFDVNGIPRVIWEGLNTQSGEAVDLIINELRFSLKEDSYILENMGLYKLMNSIMGRNAYSRGLHVFEEFAPAHLNKWFDITRDLLLICDDFPFITEGRDYESSVDLEKNGTLRLAYLKPFKKVQSQIADFTNCSYTRFEKSTTSLTREKVFAKWLKETVENLDEYKAAKKACAVE